MIYHFKYLFATRKKKKGPIIKFIFYDFVIRFFFSIWLTNHTAPKNSLILIFFSLFFSISVFFSLSKISVFFMLCEIHYYDSENYVWCV